MADAKKEYPEDYDLGADELWHKIYLPVVLRQLYP